MCFVKALEALTRRFFLANEQAQQLQGYRIYAVAKTHGATAGLEVDG